MCPIRAAVTVFNDNFIDQALLLQSQIAQLKHPQSRVLAVLRDWLKTPYAILHGKAQDYLELNKNDLVALKSPAEMDFLSVFLRRHLDQNVPVEHPQGRLGNCNPPTSS